MMEHDVHLQDRADLVRNIRGIAAAPDAIKDKIREAIAYGNVSICGECLLQMQRHGISRNDIIAMIRQALGGVH